MSLAALRTLLPAVGGRDLVVVRKVAEVLEETDLCLVLRKKSGLWCQEGSPFTEDKP